jgi:hypothetical protein
MYIDIIDINILKRPIMSKYDGESQPYGESDDDEFNEDDEVCVICDKIMWRNGALKIRKDHYVHHRCLYNKRRESEIYRKYYGMEQVRCDKCHKRFIGVCYCGLRLKHCMCEMTNPDSYLSNVYLCAGMTHLIIPFSFRIGIQSSFPYLSKITMKPWSKVILQEKDGSTAEITHINYYNSAFWTRSRFQKRLSE